MALLFFYNTNSSFLQQIIQNVEKECTLRAECHWNTELLLHLAVIEREKMKDEGVTEVLELMYMVETEGDIIVPVNIGEQTEESLQGRRRVALVKQLKDGGHVFLLKELLFLGGNILPNFLKNIQREEWVTFHKNQIRADFNGNSKLISVFDVKLIRSNNKPNQISFWDAMAHQVANPYDINSWETVVSNEFIRVYNVAVNQKQELPAKLIHFYNEMIADRIKMGVNIEDDDVLEFIATFLACTLVFVQVCSNGLGYIVKRAIVGEGVTVEAGTIIVLVHVEGTRYDSLVARTYPTDFGGEKEAAHTDAIAKVVRAFLVGVEGTVEVIPTKVTIIT